MGAFYALAVLACPVGMGLMMWFMMRGNRRHDGTPADENRTAGYAGFSPDPREQEVAALRKQVDALRARLDDGRPQASAEEHTR